MTKLYKNSFTFFCKDVVKQPIGQIHRNIIMSLEDDIKSNYSIMVSRGFYKTYVFSRAYPLWLIYKSDKPIHIIIQSMNQDMARRILGLIRDVLVSNPHFAKYKFKKETDKLLEMYLPGKENDAENTHRIYSVPIGTRGLHGDLVICHEKGTEMYYNNSWIPVENNPTAKEVITDGYEFRLHGLPFTERVSSDHQYYVKGHFRKQKGHGKNNTFYDYNITNPEFLPAYELDTHYYIGYPINKK